MTEEKAKSLIRRKVKGFEFESNDSVVFTPKMKHYIGIIGKIIDFEGCDFLVSFEDNSYYYPASLIEAHLVEESVDRKISDFKEGAPILETDLVQVSTSEFTVNFPNITASELINQNEQLKAENAELLDALKHLLYSCPCDADITNDFFKANEKAHELIEKHGK